MVKFSGRTLQKKFRDDSFRSFYKTLLRDKYTDRQNDKQTPGITFVSSTWRDFSSGYGLYWFFGGGQYPVCYDVTISKRGLAVYRALLVNTPTDTLSYDQHYFLNYLFV